MYLLEKREKLSQLKKIPYKLDTKYYRKILKVIKIICMQKYPQMLHLLIWFLL